MRFYVATLEYSEEDPDTANAFYSELESVIKKVKSGENCVIADDFIAKTGTTVFESNIYKKKDWRIQKRKRKQ